MAADICLPAPCVNIVGELGSFMREHYTLSVAFV